ncbi:hypothetical protein [Pseudolysinimonas sp.]|jgi:hypothetical protein|uniref:hypothetical protein n=1 Tax=Pseudolysinimonas sp. TaxID=2680009 RepID=UPI0037834F90
MDADLEAQFVAREANDPLVRPATAGSAVFERLLESLTDERGVHLETITTILGALAGRACRVAADSDDAGRTFARVETTDGEGYTLGDAINWPLAESPTSVWAILAGAVVEQGGTPPDLAEAFRHSVQTLGGPEFGIPRYTAGTRSSITPAAAVATFWPPAIALIEHVAPDPRHAPIALGFALKRLVEAAAPGGADLEAIARVALDSALTTAKLEPPVS